MKSTPRLDALEKRVDKLEENPSFTKRLNSILELERANDEINYAKEVFARELEFNPYQCSLRDCVDQIVLKRFDFVWVDGVQRDCKEYIEQLENEREIAIEALREIYEDPGCDDNYIACNALNEIAGNRPSKLKQIRDFLETKCRFKRGWLYTNLLKILRDK